MQRVDDEQMRRGRVALGGVVVDAGRSPLQAFEGRGERERVAADLRAQLVGLIFARPADRHLHQHGGHGGENRDEQGADEAERAIAPPAEKQAEIRQHRHRATHLRC